MSRSRTSGSARRLVLLIVVALVLLAGCARKSAIDADNEAADTTSTSTSTSTSTTSTLPAVPAEDPAASSTTSSTPDDGVFDHSAAEIAAFRAAYSQAFEAECRRIWSTYAGGDGLLGDPDFPEDVYSVDDCVGELDPDWGEFADSVAEAQSSGSDEAQIAASDIADPLCATAGSPCWSYGDS